ncbi:hypothetical protein VPH49_22100 [Pseudomonas luteola]|uniref:hypothetical protein n=1 Tax=Pseudomonas luteola TaxID=47886 RepID=UPI003A8770CF
MDMEQKQLTKAKTELEIQKLERELLEFDNLRLHRWAQFWITFGGIIAGLIVTYIKQRAS